MAKPRKEDMCPKCYLSEGEDVPLVYHLGSTQPMRCKKEEGQHVYEDREELSLLTRQMNDQKRALAPKAEVPVPVIDEPLPPPDEENKAGQSTNPLPTDGVKGMVIPPIDMVRLTSILGTFKDSSTLFGTVFSLQQQLKDANELLRKTQQALAVVSKASNDSVAPKAGGDAVVQLVVPERHVSHIRDIADANGMDITGYMNAKVESALDNMWFY